MPKQHSYFVYILASKRNGTLYIGVTNNLIRRVLEHKDKIFKGFTSKYCIDKLVHFETFHQISDAIRREHNLKTWKRKWKLSLIENNNKSWKDLFFDLVDEDQIKAIRESLKYREIIKTEIKNN